MPLPCAPRAPRCPQHAQLFIRSFRAHSIYKFFPLLMRNMIYTDNGGGCDISASKSSIRRFVITEKAPIRAFSWLKAATTAFTFKTLLRHYAKRALTPWSLNVKLSS